MKAERTNTFVPIKLVLETQEEVDKLFAVFNCCPIADALNLGDTWRILGSFADNEPSKQYHRDLLNAFRNYDK
jgi:hypothetical protein